MTKTEKEAFKAGEIYEGVLKSASDEQLEYLIYKTVAAAGNMFVVARALREALRDDWEREDLARLLTEELGV